MKPRSIVVLALLAVAAMFAALNWPSFAAPTRLNLVFWQAAAPLGVILLAFAGLLSLVYLALLARIEGTALLEGRKQARELERVRKLAEAGEDSRLRQLGDQIGGEFESLRVMLDEITNALKNSQSIRAQGPAPSAGAPAKDD